MLTRSPRKEKGEDEKRLCDLSWPRRLREGERVRQENWYGCQKKRKVGCAPRRKRGYVTLVLPLPLSSCSGSTTGQYSLFLISCNLPRGHNCQFETNRKQSWGNLSFFQQLRYTVSPTNYKRYDTYIQGNHKGSRKIFLSGCCSGSVKSEYLRSGTISKSRGQIGHLIEH